MWVAGALETCRQQPSVKRGPAYVARYHPITGRGIRASLHWVICGCLCLSLWKVGCGRALENLVNAFMVAGMGPDWRECQQKYGELGHCGCSPCSLIKYGIHCHLPEASTEDGVNSRDTLSHKQSFKSFLHSLKGAEEAAPISTSLVLSPFHSLFL